MLQLWPRQPTIRQKRQKGVGREDVDPGKKKWDEGMMVMCARGLLDTFRMF